MIKAIKGASTRACVWARSELRDARVQRVHVRRANLNHECAAPGRLGTFNSIHTYYYNNYKCNYIRIVIWLRLRGLCGPGRPAQKSKWSHWSLEKQDTGHITGLPRRQLIGLNPPAACTEGEAMQARRWGHLLVHAILPCGCSCRIPAQPLYSYKLFRVVAGLGLLHLKLQSILAQRSCQSWTLISTVHDGFSPGS